MNPTAIVIGAVVNKKHPHRPKYYVFGTMLQEEVESEMTRLGYGCGQYTLQHFSVEEEVDIYGLLTGKSITERR